MMGCANSVPALPVPRRRTRANDLTSDLLSPRLVSTLECWTWKAVGKTQQTTNTVMSKEIELKLKEGDPAPKFTAATETGETVSLADCAGKNVILYFYPKDDTPGCTKEACAFRD